MDIIFSASIIAAFMAGMVALFAPCCITVLLPAYLASAFREKKNILKMTLIFFSGIAVVLIPIGLGVAALAQVFQNYHTQMYILGGLIMIALAVLSIFGKGLALVPMSKRLKPGADFSHPKSVFILGIFSGAATSCCAPVLAGAVTLAVVSGAFWKAIIVTFAYVFGMVFPLFIAAYFYDRFKLEKSKLIQGKILELKIFGKNLMVHSTNLIAGVIFLVMGTVLVYLGKTGNAYWSPAWQAKIGTALNRFSNSSLNVLMKVPNLVWGSVILLIFAFFIVKARRKMKDSDAVSSDDSEPAPKDEETVEDKKNCCH
ncbi:MAG: cytochrome c biogenesis CcdA family protein [Patescibacteria group bacterium]|mgnify:FL=1